MIISISDTVNFLFILIRYLLFNLISIICLSNLELFFLTYVNDDGLRKIVALYNNVEDHFWHDLFKL